MEAGIKRWTTSPIGMSHEQSSCAPSRRQRSESQCRKVGAEHPPSGGGTLRVSRWSVTSACSELLGPGSVRAHPIRLAGDVENDQYVQKPVEHRYAVLFSEIARGMMLAIEDGMRLPPTAGEAGPDDEGWRPSLVR